MGTTTVYLDVIFFDNLFMDFFILDLSVHLSKTGAKIYRILLGACLGASYAVCVVLSENYWLTNMMIKLMVCLMMVLIVGVKDSMSNLIKLFGWVIVISFFCAGMFFFIMYLNPSSIKTTNGVISFLNKPLKVKLYGTIASYFILSWFFQYIYEYKKMKHNSVTVYFRSKGKEYQFIGLVDSGNQLIHPQKKCPLPIIYIKALDIIAMDESVKNEYEFIQKVSDMVAQSKEPQKFFTVSYKTISQEHAMMPGIVVENFTIIKDDKKLFKAEQYPVALTMNKIQFDKKCGGIVPAVLLEEKI